MILLATEDDRQQPVVSPKRVLGILHLIMRPLYGYSLFSFIIGVSTADRML